MKNITNKELQRMKNLMGIKKPINESNTLSSTELIKESSNGKFYGIVRENKKYFIKESNDGINFDFIGGLANKTKNQFESYEQAVRRLNLMLEDTDVLTPDIISEKKFVIKTKKKKKKAAETDDFGFGGEEESTEEGGDDFDFGGAEEGESEEGGDDFDFGDEGGGESEEETTDEEGGDEEESTEEEESDEDLDLEDDPIKSIQKMTGKLGQKLRDTLDVSSDMSKWVAKSVISALDLEQMDAEDKKDIIRAIKKKKDEGSDEEFDFMSDMADWSKLTADERRGLINREEDDMYGPGDGGLEKGEEIILDDEDNEDNCSYCGDNRYMPYDEEDDEYPGMGSDWRRPMSYMDDPYMMPQPAPTRREREAPTREKEKEKERKTPPSRKPFEAPPFIDPNDPDANPKPKAEHECTHCNGYGYDDMTGEECEWCMGTGHEEITHQYNQPTDKYYDNVQDYGTSQVMDFMEEPEYYGSFEKDKWLTPMDTETPVEGPGYEYDEFEYPDYESFRASEFGKDPENKWFAKGDTGKRFFDQYRDKFGPMKIRKRRPPHDYDETSKIFGQLDHMEDIDLGPKIHGRPSNDRVTHRGTKSKTYLSNNQKSNRAAEKQARLDMGKYFVGVNKDKSPTDEWRKHQLPYDTKFDFMEDDDMEMCNACEGKGREMHRIGFSRRESTCPICDGAGYVPRTEAGGEVDEPYVDDSNPMGYKSSSTLPSKVGYNVQYREKFNFPFNMGENKKRRKSLTEDHINDKMATHDQEMAYEDIEAMARQNGMEVEFCHKDRSKDVEEQTVYLDLMKNGKAVAKIRINSVGQIEMGHMTGKVFKGEPVDSYPDFDEVLREKRIKMSPAPAPTREKEREKEKEKEKEKERKTPPSRKPFEAPPFIDPNDPDANPNPKAKKRKSLSYMDDSKKSGLDKNTNKTMYLSPEAKKELAALEANKNKSGFNSLKKYYK